MSDDASFEDRQAAASRVQAEPAPAGTAASARSWEQEIFKDHRELAESKLWGAACRWVDAERHLDELIPIVDAGVPTRQQEAEFERLSLKVRAAQADLLRAAREIEERHGRSAGT
jgi:hypothetical protein